MNQVRTVALVDDHALWRKGLSALINSFPDYQVVLEAAHGRDLINRLGGRPPDTVLLDIHMPEMDGFETCRWLQRQYPEVSVMALSMYEAEETVLRMLRCGARGYLSKSVEPAEIRRALDGLAVQGYYFGEALAARLGPKPGPVPSGLPSPEELNEREREFLRLACSELTYKEIAQRMYLSPRTIDGYRDALFSKLKARTRVGLVLYAIKNGVVTLAPALAAAAGR